MAAITAIPAAASRISAVTMPLSGPRCRRISATVNDSGPICSDGLLAYRSRPPGGWNEPGPPKSAAVPLRKKSQAMPPPDAISRHQLTVHRESST